MVVAFGQVEGTDPAPVAVHEVFGLPHRPLSAWRVRRQALLGLSRGGALAPDIPQRRPARNPAGYRSRARPAPSARQAPARTVSQPPPTMRWRHRPHDRPLAPPAGHPHGPSRIHVPRYRIVNVTAGLRPCPTWSVDGCAGHGEWTVGMDRSGRIVGVGKAVTAAGAGSSAGRRGREHRNASYGST
jgi:hypothetical protein